MEPRNRKARDILYAAITVDMCSEKATPETSKPGDFIMRNMISESVHRRGTYKWILIEF